jgi:hypothetical protein
MAEIVLMKKIEKVSSLAKKTNHAVDKIYFVALQKKN